MLAVLWGCKSVDRNTFSYETLTCFTQNVLLSTLSHNNKATKDCIQLLRKQY